MEILLGLILLVLGGDLLVRGSVITARKFGVSELMIGLTLVGFGTSTPELFTSIKAAFMDAPGIAVGNVVGSNIANILLILGVSAAIYPIRSKISAIKRDGTVMIFSALCCLALVLYGRLSMLPGVIFVISLITYVLYTYFKERNTSSPSAQMHESEGQLVTSRTDSLLFGLSFAIAGIAITVFGAKYLVEGSVELARSMGISETIIGLTIVAVGTSLPELITSVMAAIRRNSDIALGNVIGSNIYNIWFILGATAIIHPIDVPDSIVKFDIWVMLLTSFLLFALLLTRARISRTSGIVFLALYLIYIIVLTQ